MVEDFSDKNAIFKVITGKLIRIVGVEFLNFTCPGIDVMN